MSLRKDIRATQSITEPTTEPHSMDSLGGSGQFLTTHWSIVLAAGGETAARKAEALEKLCRTYWYPLYCFVRRRGYQPYDAQDLTQSFFERLLDKNYLKAVDRRKGRFRSFLLAALEHFLANEWRRAQAQKRGGRSAFISLDEASAEEQYMQAAASGLTPQKLYEREWAATLLENVLARLRQEFIGAGKAAMFEHLKIFLTGEKRAISYAALSATMGTSESSLKMAVSRMRKRYGELLQEEIANTVSRPEEVEDELRGLFVALSE